MIIWIINSYILNVKPIIRIYTNLHDITRRVIYRGILFITRKYKKC